MNRADLASLSREQLIELVLELSERVAKLEAKLALPPNTPENSSLPPSGGRKPSAGHKRKRRRKGRPGIARALDPTRRGCVRSAPPADMPPGSPFGEHLRAMALHLRFS